MATDYTTGGKTGWFEKQNTDYHFTAANGLEYSLPYDPSKIDNQFSKANTSNSNYKGYHFYVGEMELPYAPSELKITVNSNNKTVELIDGSEINILKNPKLTDIEFDVDLPGGRQYPFANKYIAPELYIKYFEKVMINKTPIKLVITRPNPMLKGQGFSNTGSPSGKKVDDFFSNEITVSLEGYTRKESAENAFDVTVSLKFKQYVEYGTKRKLKSNQNTSSGKSATKPVETAKKTVTENKQHTVVSGDNLWKIARKHYGTATQSLVDNIYNTNKTVIEETAKKYGKKDSNKGWWIYPGTKLTIPAKN